MASEMQHTPSEVDKQDGKRTRPFADWLLEQRQGATHTELTVALNELVEAVHEHGKGGELVLKVKVKPATKTGHGAVVVSDDVQVKKPMGERAEALFFVDRDGNLTRDNPTQPRLPLREVPPPGEGATEAKEA